MIYKTPTYYLILFFLLTKVYYEFKNRKFYYNKFLLERYLYDLKFKGIKIVDTIDKLFKGKSHIIKSNKWYKTEKETLRVHFKFDKQ